MEGGFLRGFAGLHTHNPFGALRFWLENDIPVAWPRALGLEAFALAGVGLLLSARLGPFAGALPRAPLRAGRDVSRERRPAVGDRPLSWWAVKRVTEYSGRINLWLAGGFCLLYAVYIVAADHWPAWMGRHIFLMCDQAGGVGGAGGGAGGARRGACRVPVWPVGQQRRRTDAGGWNCCCSPTCGRATTGMRPRRRHGGGAGAIS